jgi:23S rRNA (uracil1939-C5)-methyltransferase
MIEPFVLTPTTYAYGGESIARLPDGRAVFIPFTIPGESVRVELNEEKPGYARARLLEVLEPSPQRSEPRCAHFGECGGCQYQHMSYAAQVEAKTAILKEQLERIGKLSPAAVQRVSPSGREYEYRNYIQLHLAPDGTLGYLRPRSSQVLTIRECHLPEPPISALRPQLEFEPGAGIERIGLRLGAGDDLQVILESKDPRTPELSIEGLPVSVVHLSPAGTLVLAGSPTITIEVLGRPFRVSAGSFFQTNTGVAASMAAYVVERLEARGCLQSQATALDLYCGAGLFSSFLASRVGRLVGVESSPGAVDDFSLNLDEFDHVEIYEAPVEQVLHGLDFRPEFILADPPREGLGKGVVVSLLKLGAPLFVYISCDPATLARDARRLSEGGYALAELALFDQFPQTAHIESISLWERGS